LAYTESKGWTNALFAKWFELLQGEFKRYIYIYIYWHLVDIAGKSFLLGCAHPEFVFTQLLLKNAAQIAKLHRSDLIYRKDDHVTIHLIVSNSDSLEGCTTSDCPSWLLALSYNLTLLKSLNPSAPNSETSLLQPSKCWTTVLKFAKVSSSLCIQDIFFFGDHVVLRDFTYKYYLWWNRSCYPTLNYMQFERILMNLFRVTAVQTADQWKLTQFVGNSIQLFYYIHIYTISILWCYLFDYLSSLTSDLGALIETPRNFF